MPPAWSSAESCSSPTRRASSAEQVRCRVGPEKRRSLPRVCPRTSSAPADGSPSRWRSSARPEWSGCMRVAETRTAGAYYALFEGRVPARWRPCIAIVMPGGPRPHPPKWQTRTSQSQPLPVTDAGAHGVSTTVSCCRWRSASGRADQATCVLHDQVERWRRHGGELSRHGWLSA
jgi:hypothetical protein